MKRLLLAFLIVGAACGDSSDSGDAMLSAKYVVHAASGAEIRTDSIAEGGSAKLAEGESATIGTTRYTAKSGGGELSIVKGRLKARNVEKKDLLKG